MPNKKTLKENENKLAEWLASTRLAKYRHDNGLDPIEDHVWYDSLLDMAKGQGCENMFEPTPKQLIELAESCGTICSAEYNNG